MAILYKFELGIFILSLTRMFFEGQSNSWSETENKYYFLLFSVTVVQMLSITLVTLSMIIYGVRLRRRLSSGSLGRYSQYEDPNQRESRIKALRRINSILAVCMFCYILRAMALGRTAIDYIILQEQHDHMPCYIYFPVFVWGTFLVSVSTTLFALREH
jgi:hypothetical protein